MLCNHERSNDYMGIRIRSKVGLKMNSINEN